MEKVNKTDLRSFRNDEHFQFFTDFINLVNSVGAAKLNVQKQFNAFLGINREEDEALKKIMKSVLTDKIIEADLARDTVFDGMAETNRTALNHFKPTVREAARRLQIVFDTYGNVARKAAAEETSAITNLLAELMHKHETDMTTVGLDPWAEELHTRNRAVQTLMAERYDETAARTDLVLKEVRTRADAAYRAITGRIDALALLEADGDDTDDEIPGKLSEPVGALSVDEQIGGSVYTDFIRRLNAIIDRANHILAQRSGRSATPKTDSGEPKTENGK